MENSLQSLDAYEVTQVQHDQNIIQLDTIERANVDSQIATAKQYPRDLRRAINNSIAMATLDVPTAQSCGYALPRGGKPITGPSVHLAKLIVSNYGNIRAEAKVVQITDKQVISRGTCWDLENNVATAFEVRRSIVGRSGQRFSDDMITVTGNAANAIAYRNAVFSVIPKAITDKVYQAAQHTITGDLSDEDKIIARRKKCIDFFKDEFGISEQEVVMLCGKQTVNQIKANEIALLLGITQSLTDGDTTVDDLMKPYRKEETKNTIAAAAAEAAKNAAAKKEDKK
uniref:hypothetical protein n=1 Tax=Prevotella sp. TaxID=59823 RepID=UPI00204501FF|nr:MAG TPA: hypothetical protein [Caudoviricetes sp.]